MIDNPFSDIYYRLSRIEELLKILVSQTSKKPPPNLSLSCFDISLSVRAQNAIKYYFREHMPNLNYSEIVEIPISEFSKYIDEGKFIKVRGVGKKAIEEISREFAKYNISLFTNFLQPKRERLEKTVEKLLKDAYLKKAK